MDLSGIEGTGKMLCSSTLRTFQNRQVATSVESVYFYWFSLLAI